MSGNGIEATHDMAALITTQHEAAGTTYRAANRRGWLRIYLGYAPGAGTTSALLGEGRRRAEQGTDVVVAHAETHGRPGPSALLAGLEVVPPARMPYRGTMAEEMDVAAVLARRPQVALVDEFAHSNVPGGRHATRWQDVEDLLEAGIDVISTVGIGNLDSLADVVEKITGAALRQTVPDPVVRAADEVELVDLAPEALRDRMACGHIYAPWEAEAALGGWFRIGNLSMLRELALLWLAAKLASDPQRYRPGRRDSGSGHARERVVAALGGGPEGELLIRRAARIADRCGGDLLAVHAAGPGGPAAADRAVLTAHRQLTESLGGTYHQLTRLTDEDVPTTLLAFAHAKNATQLVFGATPRTWSAGLWPRTSISSRVIRRGGGIGVHIVTCAPTADSAPSASGERNQGRRTTQQRRRTVTELNTPRPGRVRLAARWGRRRSAPVRATIHGRWASWR